MNKFNTLSSFNFFFNNSSRNSVVYNNFINNQFLIRSFKKIGYKKPVHPHKFPIHVAARSLHNKYDNTSSKVGKIITCQDVDTTHIPFEVMPKSQPLQESLKSIIKTYIKLTKPNLTILVTLSSICSYALSPYSVSLPELMFLSIGTALCSGSANAINMGREPDFDRKMVRTSNRPVVIGQIKPQSAYLFASISGLIGCSMLYFGVNPTVSLLGFLNIVLYAWIYTSLKRIHILNTWVGAIVGAIPPLMGWAALSSLWHPGAWCLAGLLYAWQFPHFNALSHSIAQQYKEAGYVMTAAENPKLNARVSLRYSLLMFPLCIGLSYYNITDWVFPFDSFILNSWLTILAYNFWRQQVRNHSGNAVNLKQINLANIHARKLFWGSVWHLPGILILAMLHKKGQWNNIFYHLGFKSKDTFT